ncbi:hypothetical protein GCM10009548_55850 [Streptomyces malaysiensis subsp. malaysiensis]|uniref:hypothetical protein n=1 Tax=Streptomyces TaxID=1883 RepID=UPI001E2C210E|nr:MULTISPECIES: hypothetical protein [Streptomyces]UHH21256.1 hypothetical protein LUV23_36240 [Streptomyces sp. HNM0561]
MITDPQSALPWAPPTEDIEALPVGEWWDAVSAPAPVADRALSLLGDRSGAVIQDGTHGKAYWLIEVDTAQSWCVRQVHVLTRLVDEKTLIGIPPATWTRDHDTYWRVPYRIDRYLTDTRRLHEALAQASWEVLGPKPNGRQLCHRCQLPTDEPIPVPVEHTGSVAAATRYVCPMHARNYPHTDDVVLRAAARRRALDQGRSR